MKKLKETLKGIRQVTKMLVIYFFQYLIKLTVVVNDSWFKYFILKYITGKK